MIGTWGLVERHGDGREGEAFADAVGVQGVAVGVDGFDHPRAASEKEPPIKSGGKAVVGELEGGGRRRRSSLI